MPITPTYPGVYIEEVPSGVRTIAGVATSITAFIGRALRGPVNEPVVVNNYGDFERIFGGLWVESTLGYAVRDFYLNGGSQAIIVRLFHPYFRDGWAAAQPVARDAAEDVVESIKTSTAEILENVAKAGRTKAKSYTTEPQKTAADKVAKAAEEAAGQEGAVKDDVVSAAEGAVNDAVSLAAPVTTAHLTVGNLTLEAASEGAWGNALRARVDHDVSEDIATKYGLNQSDLFNLTIRDVATDVTEQFRNITVKPSPRQVDKVLENQSGLVRVVTTPLPSTRPGAGDVGVALGDQASNGHRLEEDDFAGSGKEGAKEGLYALEKADLFNLLCIPPNNPDDDVDEGVVTAAAVYCEKRRAFLLVDAPNDWGDKDAAIVGIKDGVGTTSKNAAIFFPRLRQPNPLRDNQMEDFAPCGAVAGVFARTDAQRGVWKAPAGLEATLVGVPQLSVPLTDVENGELNPLGVNCLRTMPPAGRIIWGARTLQGDDRLASEWKYVSVRRLALYIEESLYRGTQWVVFEPNDEPLWAQIRLNLGAFMHSLFRQGAFAGKSPAEAYFVKCNKETTTQDDINRGIVNILVGFAPLRPAEFVIIKISQITRQG